MISDKEKKRVGKLGEDEACAFLIGKGQTVVDRNWRSGHLELDIVTVDGRGIHFVEVKTRRPPMQADPQDNVGFTKQQRLTQAALAYLAEKDHEKMADLECFFDIVTVVFKPDGVETEYFPEAFIPIYYGR